MHAYFSHLRMLECMSHAGKKVQATSMLYATTGEKGRGVKKVKLVYNLTRLDCGLFWKHTKWQVQRSTINRIKILPSLSRGRINFLTVITPMFIRRHSV